MRAESKSATSIRVSPSASRRFRIVFRVDDRMDRVGQRDRPGRAGGLVHPGKPLASSMATAGTPCPPRRHDSATSSANPDRRAWVPRRRGARPHPRPVAAAFQARRGHRQRPAPPLLLRQHLGRTHGSHRRGRALRHRQGAASAPRPKPLTRARAPRRTTILHYLEAGRCPSRTAPKGPRRGLLDYLVRLEGLQPPTRRGPPGIAGLALRGLRWRSAASGLRRGLGEAILRRPSRASSRILLHR